MENQTSNPVIDPLLTLKQAAETLNLCTRTVRNMIHDEKLAAIRISERRICIRASEIERYLSECKSA